MHGAELVEEYINAWNRRDPAGIVDMMTDNGVYFDVPTNTRLSGQALLEYLAHDFSQRKFHYELMGEVLVGTTSIAFQYQTYSVDHPNDVTSRWSGAEFLTILDGKVTGIEDYYKYPSDIELRATLDAHDPDYSTKKYQKSGLRPGQAKAFKRRLLKLMEKEHLYRAADLTLPELASNMHCSMNHLSQVINSELQMSFYDFLNRYRIEDAKRLLTRDHCTRGYISEVAARVGFRSSSAFYSAFKRFCEQTPSEYRRRHRRT